MDNRAWRATVHRVAKSWTLLKLPSTQHRYGYFLMLVFACVSLSPPNYNLPPPSKGCVFFTSVCPNASTLCDR